MKKQGYFASLVFIPVLFAAAWVLLSQFRAADRPGIEINSVLVRDRVVPLDHIEMRSSILVGFRIEPGHEDLSRLRIRGELYLNGRLLSTDEITRPDSSGNNFGFDLSLPGGSLTRESLLGIPDGEYRILIELFGAKGELLARAEKSLPRNQICRRFYGFDKTCDRPEYREVTGPKGGTDLQTAPRFLGAAEETNFLVFRRSYLERVYPETVPEPSEIVSSISMECSRNETRACTFSVMALRDLGRVRLAVGQPTGTNGPLGEDSVKVGAVDLLTEVVSERSKKGVVSYRWAPKIIVGPDARMKANQSQRFWATVRVPPDAKEGDYEGWITVTPELGREMNIPIHVRVLPIQLTDTDIQYGMMMTYAFYELDNEEWSEAQKALIERGGREIYRDLRDHGMTFVYPHSHFYFKRDAGGKPVLDSLRASLKAYKELSFPGPFCWYLGHLVQTAKPFHPGSILNYDPGVSKRRLPELLRDFERMAAELGIPKEKLIVQLVDEADDRARVSAGKTLNAIARKMGFRTLVTRAWPDVDIICTGIPDDLKEAEALRSMGKTWWIYPNSALTTHNLAFTRYVFGFGAWRWGVDGVVPWTFQMSEGCNGNPFTVLDGPEVMVAYPGVKGPVTTPTWEAIRDGINDYKYIFQLKRLIAAGKERGEPRASEIATRLEKLKKSLGRGPGVEEGEYGDWTPDAFEQRRGQIVDWILELKEKAEQLDRINRISQDCFLVALIGFRKKPIKRNPAPPAEGRIDSCKCIAQQRHPIHICAATQCENILRQSRIG
jgi:hypothetical protein